MVHWLLMTFFIANKNTIESYLALRSIVQRQHAVVVAVFRFDGGGHGAAQLPQLAPNRIPVPGIHHSQSWKEINHFKYVWILGFTYKYKYSSVSGVILYYEEL